MHVWRVCVESWKVIGVCVCTMYMIHHWWFVVCARRFFAHPENVWHVVKVDERCALGWGKGKPFSDKWRWAAGLRHQCDSPA